MQDNLLNQIDLENPREAIAESRISLGYRAALALRDALVAAKNNNEVLWAKCNRIRFCALPENHWIGEDLHNKETGECYPANGTKWGCGSKLCPSCVAKLSKRSRKELQLGVSAVVFQR